MGYDPSEVDRDAVTRTAVPYRQSPGERVPGLAGCHVDVGIDPLELRVALKNAAGADRQFFPIDPEPPGVEVEDQAVDVIRNVDVGRQPGRAAHDDGDRPVVGRCLVVVPVCAGCPVAVRQTFAVPDVTGV